MPVASLALGHHRVTGLHVAQDQGSMLDPVLLVCAQLCVSSRWAPWAQGTAVTYTEATPPPPLPPLQSSGLPTLSAPAQGLLTLHRDPIDSPGDLWLGPPLHLAVQAGSLSWPIQAALGLVQPVWGSCEKGRAALSPQPVAQTLPAPATGSIAHHRPWRSFWEACAMGQAGGGRHTLPCHTLHGDVVGMPITAQRVLSQASVLAIILLPDIQQLQGLVVVLVDNSVSWHGATQAQPLDGGCGAAQGHRAGRPRDESRGRENKVLSPGFSRGFAPPSPHPECPDSQALSNALQDQGLPLQGHQVAAGVGGEEQAWLPVNHAVGCEEKGSGWHSPLLPPP